MRHVFAFALMASAALIAGCTNDAGVTCPPGQTLCGEVCVYTQSDSQNCGGCGNVCQGDLVCIGGVCGCPKGQTACNDKCVDTKSDVNNCGACGTVCPDPAVCSMGMCAGACATGLTDCSRSCVDLNNDDNNCGACGTACLGDLDCVGGMCVHQCPNGQVACGDKCASLTSDGSNCGACGNVCPNDYFCIFGSCILGCPQPMTRCVPDGGSSDGGSQCVDTRFDPNNCGGCGGADPTPVPTPVPTFYLPHLCKATPGFHDSAVCNMGSCDWSCNEGFLDCEPLDQNELCLANPAICAPSRPPPPGSFGAAPPPGSSVAGNAEEMCIDPQDDPCNCGGCFDDCGGASGIRSGNFGWCTSGKSGPPPIACCSGMCAVTNLSGSCGNCAGVNDCSQTVTSPLPSTFPYPSEASPLTAPACCPDPNVAGNNNCVDADSDLHNCGNCGNDCTGGGALQPICCGNKGPACIDLKAVTSCGNDCDNVIKDCTGVYPSPSAAACCNNSSTKNVNDCVNVQTNPDNCGACGTKCPNCAVGVRTCNTGGVCGCSS